MQVSTATTISMFGISSEFNTTRIQFLPNLKFCRDIRCLPSQGPTWSLEARLAPPTFRLFASFYANVLGNTVGAMVNVTWSGGTTFRAVFRCTPISLAGGAFQMFAVGNTASGPLATFDSSGPRLELSTRTVILAFAQDTQVLVIPLDSYIILHPFVTFHH